MNKLTSILADVMFLLGLLGIAVGLFGWDWRIGSVVMGIILVFVSGLYGMKKKEGEKEA
jgi:hypothetical protein